MRSPFRPLLLPLLAALALTACAGNGPRRPGDSPAGSKSLADQRSEFLIECQRREQLNQPRPADCPTTERESSLSQPTLGPLATPFPALPTLPGGLRR